MDNFTKEDWKVQGSTVYALNNHWRQSNRFTCLIQGGNDDNENRIEDKEIIANAHLIVSAPKMYHALIELRDFLKNRDVRILGKSLAEHFVFQQIAEKVDEALVLARSKEK